LALTWRTRPPRDHAHAAFAQSRQSSPTRAARASALRSRHRAADGRDACAPRAPGRGDAGHRWRRVCSSACSDGVAAASGQRRPLRAGAAGLHVARRALPLSAGARPALPLRLCRAILPARLREARRRRRRQVLRQRRGCAGRCGVAPLRRAVRPCAGARENLHRESRRGELGRLHGQEPC